jgi:hypothetical protein
MSMVTRGELGKVKKRYLDLAYARKEDEKGGKN